MKKLNVLLALVVLAAVIALPASANAAVRDITGFNDKSNNGGIVPLVATADGNTSYVTFQYQDESSSWVTISTDFDGSDGWKALWNTGSINRPGVYVRAFDNLAPSSPKVVSVRIQNVMAEDIYGYRDPSTGIVRFSARYVREGQTGTWPEDFPPSESCDRYSYGYSYTSTATKTKTPFAGNLTEIRTNFTDYSGNSGSGNIKFKAWEKAGSTWNLTLLAQSATLDIDPGLMTYSVNFLNLPQDTYIGFYYSTTYEVYVRKYDNSQSSELYQIYGNVVYNYGDTNNGSFYSYDYYTGAPIEFTVSSTPPAVTQMQAGYSLDGGTTWTQTVNGVLSDTQEKTYDFSWNTRDLVSDNVTLGVRTFAGTWCSWFAEGPIRVENKLYVSVTNNLGFGTVDVEGTEETVPFSGTWLYQTPYEVVAPQIVPSQSGETDVRYSFDTWSDLGSRAHDVELYWGDNPLISASYVKQVTVSVTTPYDQTQEFDGWLTTNNYYNFGVTSPHVIDSTTRYVCSGFTGTGSVPSSGDTCETGDFFLEDPSTVTFHWYAEYYFALTSEHSDDTGDLEGWYPTGTTLRCSATEIELLPASERWRTIGWTSTGSLAPGSGLDTGEFAITEPTTLTWLYDREVAIVVRANHGETDPDGRVWIRKGDQVTVEAFRPPDTDDSRFSWQGWATPNSHGYVGLPVFTYTANEASTLTAHWLGEYKVEITTNGSIISTHPADMFYEEGTDVIIETTPPSANSGERYLLSWEADGIGMDDVPPSPATPNPYSYTVLSPATVNANWVKQVQLTISDPMGAGVNMIPPIGSSWHFVGDEVAGRVDFLYQGIVCTGYTGTGSAPGSTAPLFRFDITQPSEVTWNFELRDTSNIPAPLWNEPFTLATNAFGTGCSLAWSSANSPFVAYTGAPAENQKADGKTEPDSIRVGWVFNGQWRIDVIDSGGQFGQKVNIALDSNDLPWVVYIKDSEAMVAHFDGTEWFSQIVTSSYAATNYIDIAIDEYDTAHIAFYGSSIGALIYAQPDGLIWATEEVDDVGNVGLYCSIEVMPILNWPSISYYDSTNRAVKFARLENDVWNIYGVDTNGDVGRNGNLALDPSGVPYICYQVMTEPADMGLRIAWLRPEGWQNIDLSTNSITGYDISIDIDSHGIIHVTYRDFDTLRYAWYNGVTWGVDYDVAGTQANGMTNVALDSSGNPSIVFWDGADLKFVDTAAGDYTGPIGTDETRLDTAGGGGGGGCFVATAAFGSYASDSVTALTGVRDSGIRASNSGSSLVALYYAVSPAPAGSLANSAASRALFRELLR